MGQKYFSTLPLWHTPEKLTYSWKNIQPTVPTLALEKSQLKNSSLNHTCLGYSELQRLKSPQSPKIERPPFFIFSNNVQTYLRKYLNPLQTNVFSPSLPFWASTKSISPFKLLPSFTPHHISLGDDYDEEIRERRRDDANPTFIARSPVPKYLGRTTETQVPLCVDFLTLN